MFLIRCDCKKFQQRYGELKLHKEGKRFSIVEELRGCEIDSEDREQYERMILKTWIWVLILNSLSFEIDINSAKKI
ncbi:hypothetical protein M5689_000259 [Euphorbia peplus]|nr:hypothetical protein M5689_000259 [Euphorbia peplus]